MIKNIIIGFIIGIAKIIPGVSGSMLAISLGVYERLLKVIANICSITKKDFNFLFSIILGVVSSVCLFSYGVKWVLNTFYFSIMLLFVGLIAGSIQDIIKELKKDKLKYTYLTALIPAFIISLFLTNISNGYLNNITFKSQNIVYFILGFIEAFSSIVPGISGTAIYMSLGCYDMLLDFFGNIFNPSYLKFSIAFGMGILFGIFILAKIITYLLSKHKIITYYIILGFMTSSLVLMISKAFISNISIIDFVLGVLCLIIGYKIAIKINKILSSN